MSRIFLSLVFCLTIIFSSASAQDVFATSKDGCDYYVQSETVNYNDDYVKLSDGKTYPVTRVRAAVKEVHNGKIVSYWVWEFVSVNYRTWTYSINRKPAGTFSNVNSLYAQEILHIMGNCVGKHFI